MVGLAAWDCWQLSHLGQFPVQLFWPARLESNGSDFFFADVDGLAARDCWQLSHLGRFLVQLFWPARLESNGSDFFCTRGRPGCAGLLAAFIYRNLVPTWADFRSSYFGLLDYNPTVQIFVCRRGRPGCTGLLATFIYRNMQGNLAQHAVQLLSKVARS
jgi:hypothetical protein